MTPFPSPHRPHQKGSLDTPLDTPLNSSRLRVATAGLARGYSGLLGMTIALLPFPLSLFPFPSVAFAQRPIELLEPIGTVTSVTLGTFPLDVLNQYLQPFMPLLIGSAAGLAVFMIILGGFQIMLSNGNIAQSEGKNRILAALAGLMLLVFSATVLYMLNASYYNISP